MITVPVTIHLLETMIKLIAFTYRIFAHLSTPIVNRQVGRPGADCDDPALIIVSADPE
jgi:hypothetical protein